MARTCYTGPFRELEKAIQGRLNCCVRLHRVRFLVTVGAPFDFFLGNLKKTVAGISGEQFATSVVPCAFKVPQANLYKTHKHLYKTYETH